MTFTPLDRRLFCPADDTRGAGFHNGEYNGIRGLNPLGG